MQDEIKLWQANSKLSNLVQQKQSVSFYQQMIAKFVLPEQYIQHQIIATKNTALFAANIDFDKLEKPNIATPIFIREQQTAQKLSTLHFFAKVLPLMGVLFMAVAFGILTTAHKTGNMIPLLNGLAVLPILATWLVAKNSWNSPNLYVNYKILYVVMGYFLFIALVASMFAPLLVLLILAILFVGTRLVLYGIKSNIDAVKNDHALVVNRQKLPLETHDFIFQPPAWPTPVPLLKGSDVDEYNKVALAVNSDIESLKPAYVWQDLSDNINSHNKTIAKWNEFIMQIGVAESITE